MLNMFTRLLGVVLGVCGGGVFGLVFGVLLSALPIFDPWRQPGVIMLVPDRVVCTLAWIGVVVFGAAGGGAGFLAADRLDPPAPPRARARACSSNRERP